MVTKVDAAKKVITDIRSKYGIREDGRQDEQFTFIARGYKNAIEQLSTGLYEKDIHFILELIQNAEDNEYKNEIPELRFVVLDEDPTATNGSDGCLCVFNNESGFEKKHVESICQIGASTKEKAQGYIGEKGIGFKSVFIVSSAPHIFSNNYHFKFKENDPEIELSYVVPYWIDKLPPVIRSERATTAIFLPLKPDKKNEIVTELKRIKPETILFLSRLEELSVEIRAESTAIDLIRDTSSAPVVDLLIQEDGKQTALNRFWIHNSSVSVPDHIKEEKRPGVSERHLTVAFPLESDRSRGSIFAFLPTEVKSGFPFLINADFILTANRESIQPDRKWNIWLRDSFADLIVHGLVELSNSLEHRKHLYGFIPLAKDMLSLRSFFNPVVDEVHSSLSQLKIVLTDGGDFALPEETRLATKEARKLFGGKSRAESFSQFSFVDSDIEKHGERLKAIGVVNFKKTEIQQCLSDITWLSRKRDSWFFNLYLFLNKSAGLSKAQLLGLPLIPTQDGRRVSSKNQQVYFPFNRDLARKLERKLSATNLPKVTFIDDNLYIRLLKSKKIYEWVSENLNITDFSFSAYAQGTLVPWLYEHVDILGEKELLFSTQMILENWQDLSEGSKQIIGDKLPVLLDDGSIVRQARKELVVPRIYDKQKGWQLILKAEEDFGHLNVMSDKYVSYQKINQEYFDELLNQLSAQSFPDLREFTFAEYNRNYGFDNDYVSSTFNAFNEYSPYIITIETWTVPSFFHNEAQLKTKKNRIAFLHWLEAMLENRSSALRTGTIHWSYYGAKQRNVTSALFYHLTRTPWINTTKGLKKPGEVFKRTKQIEGMFRGKLAYLEDKISSELCSFLGIKAEVTTHTILEYLIELSNKSKVSIQLIKQLYQYLDNYGKNYTDHFHEEALIYIPKTKKSWYTASEVIWDDSAEVLGDMYGWLSPVYESSKLKQFFVNEIDISEIVENEDLARAWLKLPENENQEPARIKASLSKIMPRVLSVAKSGEADRPWWEEFVENVSIWTQDNRFIDKDNVYVSDDATLGRLFSDDLYYVWKPDSLTHNYLNPLYSELGIARLSECIQISLENPGQAKVVESPSFLSTHSKLLICYMIYNDSPEKYEELKESGVLKGLLQSVESLTNSLVITYEVVEAGAEKLIEDRNAFWDFANQVLYLRSETDNEDLLDDVVEVITRAIWGSRFKKHEDRVRALLGIQEIERFRKVRDRKGWNLPPDIGKEVKTLIDGTGQLSLEIEDTDDQFSDERNTEQPSIEDTEPSNNSAQSNDSETGVATHSSVQSISPSPAHRIEEEIGMKNVY